MAKKEEKAKVGRPKLADDPMKKDSLISIGLSLVIAFVLCVGGIGSMAGAKPWEVLTVGFNDMSASVAKPKVEKVRYVRHIPAQPSRVVEFK